MSHTPVRLFMMPSTNLLEPLRFFSDLLHIFSVILSFAPKFFCSFLRSYMFFCHHDWLFRHLKLSDIVQIHLNFSSTLCTGPGRLMNTLLVPFKPDSDCFSCGSILSHRSLLKRFYEFSFIQRHIRTSLLYRFQNNLPECFC